MRRRKSLSNAATSQNTHLVPLASILLCLSHQAKVAFIAFLPIEVIVKAAPLLQESPTCLAYARQTYIPHITETQAFSEEGPIIWQGIAEMLHQILPELSAMEENLAIFKEIFAQHIRAIMRALRIHDNTRVVVGLDEEGALHIIHMRHEKAAELEAILSKDDEAREQLAAIALRTKMLTQLEHLDDTLNAIMQPPLVAKGYNMCLIGDLSHFYISR